MLVKSKYRLMGKASWGIAINVTAEWNTIASTPADAVQMTERLWCSCDDRSLTTEELHYLMLGVKVVADSIARQIGEAHRILIRVGRIDFNPTDYQPEGIVAAMAFWASEAFHFPKPEITGRYDKDRRKYTFTFDPCPDSASEEANILVESSQRSVEYLRDARRLLEQGQLVSATQRAGSIVGMALQRVIRNQAHEPRDSGETRPATIEHLLTVIGRTKPKAIPVSINRHAIRVGTWYSDLKLGMQRPSKREAEAYLHSAQQVISWVNEVAPHEPV
jgi:hypothetical protein